MMGNATIRFVGAYFLPGADMSAAPESIWVEITSKASTWRGEVQLRLKDLNIKNLRGICPFLDMGMSDRAANQRLMQQLMEDLQGNRIPIGYYFDEMGAVHLPDGSLGFIRGDTFCPGDFAHPYLIDQEIGDIELCGDSSSSAQHILMILRMLPPQALLVMAYVILTSVRSLVIGCGVGLQAILYITGKNGIGKSQLAKRMAIFYRRKKTGKPVGIVEADSTNAATDCMLHLMRDMPVVVDDLCLSSGRETERKRREQGARLVRKGTSEMPTIKKLGSKTVELRCNAGIILTAEFTMETESDLNRCLIVPMTDYLDLPGELTPQLIGDAIRLFSTWFAANSETELNRLKRELTNGDWRQGMPHRIRTSYTCLRWAFQSLITALDPDNRLPECSNPLLKQMDKALNIAWAAHMQMGKRILETVPRGNLAAVLYDGKKNDAFNLATNPKKLAKYSGIIWQKDLCLKPDALVQYVRTQPGFHNWTRNRIIQELKDIGALVLQEENASTVHIDKDLPRVYRIRLDVLKDMAEYY